LNLPEGRTFGGVSTHATGVADSGTAGDFAGAGISRGLAKWIKYGLIADAKLFAFLEKQMDAILRRDLVCAGACDPAFDCDQRRRW